MTFSFTALGVLIAFCWVQAVGCLVIALCEGIRRKWGPMLGYGLTGVLLVFLLVVR